MLPTYKNEGRLQNIRARTATRRVYIAKLREQRLARMEANRLRNARRRADKTIQQHQ